MDGGAALGDPLGELLGDALGESLGDSLGDPSGESLGALQGTSLGTSLGASLEMSEGAPDGDSSGTSLGADTLCRRKVTVYWTCLHLDDDSDDSSQRRMGCQRVEKRRNCCNLEEWIDCSVDYRWDNHSKKRMDCHSLVATVPHLEFREEFRWMDYLKNDPTVDWKDYLMAHH